MLRLTGVCRCTEGNGMTLEVQCAAIGCARFSGRVSVRLVIVTAFILAPWLSAYAQSIASPEDEYKRLVKVSEDIHPLGDTPFGERIGLYDGSLSFEQVDI